MESALGYARGKQDLGNSVVAAAITGALYKSAGWQIEMACVM